MSQYKTGTVDVANGDATVVGNGTLFLTEVTIGDIFVRDGDIASYEVGSITDDTNLELTGNYVGVTGAGVNYSISRDFTSPDNIPFMNQLDIATAQLFTRAMLKIQALFSSGGLNQQDIILALVPDAEAGLIFYDGLLPGKNMQVNAISIFAGLVPVGADIIFRLTRDAVEVVGQDATLADGVSTQKTTLGTPQTFTTVQRLGFKCIQAGSGTPGAELILTLHIQ